MKISRIIIFTPDVRRLSDFYRGCFGLNVIGDADDGWTELDAGGCGLAFHKFADETAGRDSWTKVVFGAKNVAEEKRRLEELGVEMSKVTEFGSIQLCDGRDPDGNWFQISSRGL